MKIKNINFKYKILGLIITIIIILTLSIIFTITNTFNSILDDIIFQSEQNNIKQKSEIISNWIIERKNDLKIYANTEVMKEGSWEEKKEYLSNELSKRVKEYYFFFIADETGNYSTTFKDNAGNISDRNYFPEIMEGNTVVSEPVISKSTNKPIIVIGTPLNTNSENKQMLAAVIRLDKLSSTINKYSNEKEGIYSFLLNKHGNVVAHPDQDKIKNQLINDKVSSFSFPDKFMNNVLNNENGNFKCKLGNNIKYAFYNKVEETDNWKMVTVLPQKHLHNSIDELNYKIFKIAIIAIIISIILSIYLAHNISKPIIKLKETFKKGAAGNLNVKADINSKDEIGEAADSFNKMMEVIKKLTFNDSLTGLPNIEFFKNKLKHTLRHLDDIDQKVYICAIGVDDFKSINDRFGHNGGDEVLKKLANKLTYNLNERRPIARVGDEFYFYFLKSEADMNYDDVYNRCNEMLQNINDNYLIGDDVVYLTASMGVSIYPDDNKNVTKLIKNASLAMHSAKRLGKGKINFYAKNIEENFSQRKSIETELSTALKKGQFLLHYQPFIAAKDQKTVGLEALIRWDHPEKGMISPGLFIPIAEDSGYITKIDDWVIRESCRQLKEIHANVSDEFFVSVNVSPKKFLNKDFSNNVKQILFDTGLEPEHLQLEITERTVMDNIEHTIQTLKELHELGVKIAMDDFGTGYSSLSYLKEFSIDILKIDKSFIDNFIENDDDLAIVNTIITIGNNLDLKIVAEGVETKEQADKLKELGCDIIQGYYYSRPFPPEEIKENIDI